MSSATSASALLGSPVGLFCAPSTETAVVETLLRSELVPVSLKIGIVEAASQLNESDGLIAARAGWKIIKLRDLWRSVRDGLRRERPKMTSAVGSGTLIETQNGDNRVRERCGQMQMPLTRAQDLDPPRGAFQDPRRKQPPWSRADRRW